MALALRRKIVLASENLTLLGFTSRLCSGNHDEQRGSNGGVGLAFPAACVATEGFCAFSPPFYDEDGIYLDSLSAPGRGRGPARLAWAVASVTAGGADGIVARRSSSPTAPSGSSVSAST